MTIARKFLDWRGSALTSAADYLISRYQRDQALDLENVVVVLPGGRAGRRLLETLVICAETQQLILHPPVITTIGSLPEMLYNPKRPMASQLVQQLAWIRALQGTGRRRIEKFIRTLPEQNDATRWLAISKLFWQLHRELAADCMHFGDVGQQGAKTQGFKESARWNFLRSVQMDYLRILDELKLWDRQTARLFAIEHKECHTDHDIILVGASDMSEAMRRMLSQVRHRVTALVFAPEDLSSAFDDFGCVAPDAWRQLPVGISQEQVRIIDGPLAQAQEVAESLVEADGAFRADEITVGILDERTVPQIQRQLQQQGVATRWVIGRALPDTSWYRLLEAVAAHLEQDRYDTFASLIRHPDVAQWLLSQGVSSSLLTEVDDYYRRHLPPKPDFQIGEEAPAELSFYQAQAAVQQWLAPLKGEKRRLGEWAAALRQSLLEIVADIQLNRDTEEGHYALEAARHVEDLLQEHEAAPVNLMPSTTASQAIRLMLDQMSALKIAPPADEHAVELLGWLELPLDDAPLLVLTSFNDRFVPASLNSDLFLPNLLRRRINLLDNARRYARDAYAISAILAARDRLTIIVPRRDSDGDPLTPSRLLFATDKESVAQRALACFAEPEQPTTELPGELSSSRAESAFFVPRPRSLEHPVSALPVTAFRDYLACPYRFYLRHVLKLTSVQDRAEELDAAQFGSLMHDVLHHFSESEIRDSTDAKQIGDLLHSSLEECVEDRFGAHRLPAVSVQLMQMRSRLNAFAQWQADWADAGWNIRFSEQPATFQPVAIEVLEGTIQVHGRIDRIDFNNRTQEWMIFDYKTSDRALAPQQTHFSKGQWVDLQLPLYRRLAELLDVPLSAKLGYVVLPKDTKQTGALVAPWSDEQLQTAEQKVTHVARQVLRSVFWPPTEPPPRTLRDFASICQEATYDKRYAPPGAGAES